MSWLLLTLILYMHCSTMKISINMLLTSVALFVVEGTHLRIETEFNVQGAAHRKYKLVQI